MMGNQTIFQVVKALLLQCDAQDVQLEIIRKPRHDARHQQMADYWSKVEDNSDYMLNKVYQNL